MVLASSLIVFLFLVFLTIIVVSLVNHMEYDEYDVEEVVVEEEKIEYEIMGQLNVFRDFNTQDYYITDPLSKEKVTVSPLHDLYEDAAGNIWELKF